MINGNTSTTSSVYRNPITPWPNYTDTSYDLNTRYIALQVATVMIAGCGAFTNFVSLLYFVMRDGKGLTNKLIMLLNCFDLCVCVSACFATTFWIHGMIYNSNFKDAHIVIHNILQGTYLASMEGTAFTTCILSVTRAVTLCLPLYRISGTAVVAAIAIFMSGVVVKNITNVALHAKYYSEYSDGSNYASMEAATTLVTCYVGILLAVLALMIGVAALSNFLTIVKLLTSAGQGRVSEDSRNITVIVAVVSVIFCSLNVVYLAYLVISLYDSITGNFSGNREIFSDIAHFLVIPFNSAANPMVYFLVKQSMRDFVTGCGNPSTAARNEEARVEYTVVEEAVEEDTEM